MSRSLSVIGGFFVRALLLLLVSLAVWYWLREWMVAPVAWLAERAMTAFFPGWVYGVKLDGIQGLLQTSLRVPQGNDLAEIAVSSNVLRFCYGLPLAVGLVLASRGQGWWWKLPLCFVALLPFQVWGVCMDWLTMIAVHAGETTRALTGFTPLQTNLIAIGYVHGSLLFPTLIPALLWLLLEKRFVTTVVFDGALDGMLGTRR